MSLYFVFKTYQPNTATTNRFLAIVKGLSEQGVCAKVCFFTPDGKESKVMGDYPNITFEYLWERHSVKGPMKVLWSIISVMRFIKRLKKEDIVYIYGFPLLLHIMSLLKRCRCYYEIDECPDVYITKSMFVRYTPEILVKCLKRITGVIVISNALKDYFIAKGINNNNVHVINMIVDLNRFNNIIKINTDNYFAYCGTVSTYKDGVDQLITAFSKFSSGYPNYKLYIIGPIPSENDKKQLLSLVKDLNIEDKVIFTGIVSFQEMPHLLINAQALLLDRPDNLQAKYGFPTKLGEYLLTGNPVVVTKVGDIPLFLSHRKNALLAEPNNIYDFSFQLQWLVEHKEECSAIGKRGKEVAIRSFNYLTESTKLYKYLTM